MTRPRMAPPDPVDLADPAAVVAWGATVHAKVDEIHPFMTDATMRRHLRKHGRRYIRRTVSRILRDVHVLLDVLSPRPWLRPAPEQIEPNAIELKAPPAG